MQGTKKTWVPSLDWEDFSWGRKWQPAPVFLPVKSLEQRSLEGYSPWSDKELDTTDWLTPSLSHFSLYTCYVLAAQSRLTLCDPVDCSTPGSSIHGILQVRILEWVATPFSRRSSQSREQTQVSCIAGGFFTIWTTRETPHNIIYLAKPKIDYSWVE